jgi:hypothetical protein
MTDETPPPLETKDLPYAPVPAPVPNPDRIGYEVAAEESDDPQQEAPATETGGKARRTKPADKE